ncbi:ComEC/Rec2 family competence protein [Cellulosimicrobium cellulans]|uniref:ComEC/Rec2 family competence protein n=1 Tax=Cellulosimicrobium cellulans TaxID=1710 RepID=UPI002096E70D|nr:ComEC/Rec2 family competence protein [Cellulosimicrobium cellulans]MCO7272317.1 ComEC/Rec2 family competence protein [Cellulosimicrobium cellulans]
MSDLRLVPAALAAWGTAFLAAGATPAAALRGASVAVVLLGVVLGVLLLGGRRGRRGTPTAPRTATSPGAARVPSGPGDRRRPARPDRPTRSGRAGSVLAQGALVVACVAAVLLSAGAQLADRQALADVAGEGATATVTAVVRSAVVPRTNPWSGAADRHEVRVSLRELTARGVTTVAAGTVVVTGPGDGWDDLAYGAAVVVTGRLAVQGDRTLLRTEGAPRVVEPPGAFLRGVHAMRRGLLDATDGLSPQARGLVPGVAVGDTSRLDPALDEAMRTTSLTHVTAVSGGHFAIVVTCVAALCVLARAPRGARVVVTGAAMVGFVVLVHPEPSVLRAAAMGAVGVVGIALGRPSRAVAALAAGVVVLLVLDPGLARSYGFVLSVAATAGLALLAAPLARRMAPWCGRTAAHVVAVPVAAQAACAPVLVLLDPSVSTWSVPANLVAAPALGPATVLGVLATLVAPWWPGAATALAWAAGIFTGWIAGVAEAFAGLPGARLPWPGGVGGLVLLALGTVVLLAVVLRSRALHEAGERRALRRASSPPLRDRVARTVRVARRRVSGGRGRLAWPGAAPRRPRRSPGQVVAGGVAAAVLAVLVVVLVRPLAVSAGPVPSDWAVVACDVGQGDALVLRSGPRSAVVVDVGPPGTAAGGCLDRLGVDRVDLLVLSHFHADHVGGLDAVLRGRAVERALVTATADPPEQAERTLAALAEAGVPVQVATAGAVGSEGGDGTAAGVRWEVLQAGVGGGRSGAARGPGPSPAGSGAASSGGARTESDGGANDASVALLLRVAGMDVVALGDLEDAGQAALARTLAQRGSGPVDVVKVAHHGSATQSDRLAGLLAPTVALVSSGENTYGHPTDRALDLYRGVGATVLRTDACGTFALVVRDGVLAAAGCG